MGRRSKRPGRAACHVHGALNLAMRSCYCREGVLCITRHAMHKPSTPPRLSLDLE